MIDISIQAYICFHKILTIHFTDVRFTMQDIEMVALGH